MIINPISKGGKGLLPEIIVTAPSGSTLDLMQGSVVLQTYTLSSTETQYTFIVKDTGTYTVRGTNGSDTASVDVVIDAIGQYSCTIEYILKLYWLGDECEDVTGGWSGATYSDYPYSSTGTLTKNSSNMVVTTTRVWCACTDNKIDITDFNKISIDMGMERGTGTSYPNEGNVLLIITSVKYAEVNGRVGMILNESTFTRDIKSLDISSLSGEYYIIFGSYVSTGTVYRIWLE